MGPLRQADVGPRVAGVHLPQFRVAGVRQNLVDAAAGHHVAAQEQGHQPAAQIDHSARPPAQGPAPDTACAIRWRPPAALALFAGGAAHAASGEEGRVIYSSTDNSLASGTGQECTTKGPPAGRTAEWSRSSPASVPGVPLVLSSYYPSGPLDPLANLRAAVDRRF